MNATIHRSMYGCPVCGQMADVTSPHICASNRLALLEAVAKAAKAWDRSGRWQDYQTLHAAIKDLEDEDA